MCMLGNDEPIIRSYIKAQRHRGRVSVHLFRRMWVVLNELCYGSIHCLMEVDGYLFTRKFAKNVAGFAMLKL